jgi:signal transduction histidine kinase
MRSPVWSSLRRSAAARDSALALALTVGGQLELWLGLGEVKPSPAVALGVLAMTLPVAWRRRYPVMTALAVAGALAYGDLLGIDDESLNAPFLALVVAIYSLGSYAESLRRSLGGAALVLFLGFVSVTAGNPPGFDDYAYAVLIVGLCWGFGRSIRRRVDEARALEERAEELERGREEQVRAAREEERTRIARELHDIVGHAVSVMVVQAGAAEQIAQTDPRRTQASLRSIRQSGRQALGELRRLLDLLRLQRGEEGFEPQPGIADLDALLDQVRNAGVQVHLTVEGSERELPRGQALSAYRIIQEALTNVVKHAAPTRAQVMLRYNHRQLVIEVVDEGNGARPPDDGDRGSGLIGMGERVALFDGELKVGRRPNGGFSVWARLPLESQP